MFYLDKHEIHGFRPNPYATTQSCFESMLFFMGAAAEAQRRVDQGRYSDNADLFDPEVMRWCQEHSSEIEMVQCELEQDK